MSTTRTLKLLAVLVLTFLLTKTTLSAPAPSPAPNLAGNFYGGITVNGEPASIGTDVVVFSDNKICGRYVVQIEGKYGLMNCNAKRLENLRFEINGEEANAVFVTGERVDLTADILLQKIPWWFDLAVLLLLLMIIAYLVIKENGRRILRT